MLLKIIFKTVLVSTLILYILLLIRLLFFNVGATDRQSYFKERQVHYVPFKSTIQSIRMAQDFLDGPKQTSYYWYLAARNVFGNMLLFIPIGLIIPLLNRNFSNIKAVIFTAFCLSLLAEIIQYLFILGISDIDDIIYNIVGATVGFFLYSVTKRILHEKNI